MGGSIFDAYLGVTSFGVCPLHYLIHLRVRIARQCVRPVYPCPYINDLRPWWRPKLPLFLPTSNSVAPSAAPLVILAEKVFLRNGRNSLPRRS